ncbi:hypothetical protein XELAEV_18001101mg [Xenopus laevis]|uniref:Uncharacterized protein n=1 Tax=Xenopus laevis TaxID=8355 RepID=A0A974GYI3_XENLA|nr:hypothetical protein XELAEV_18001101mg [Xenopus laevis]
MMELYLTLAIYCAAPVTSPSGVKMAAFGVIASPTRDSRDYNSAPEPSPPRDVTPVANTSASCHSAPAGSVWKRKCCSRHVTFRYGTCSVVRRYLYMCVCDVMLLLVRILCPFYCVMCV